MLQYAYKEMTTKLNSKPELIDKIIPKDFNVACRRPTPGNGYLEALAHEKTTAFTETTGFITPRGFVDSTTGEEHEVDVIICATGFDTSFRPRFPVIGLDPKPTLAEKWAEYPCSYLGISVDGFPNYLMYSGPSTPDLDQYSGRAEWEQGIMFNQDPNEFIGVSDGRVPGRKEEVCLDYINSTSSSNKVDFFLSMQMDMFYSTLYVSTFFVSFNSSSRHFYLPHYNEIFWLPPLSRYNSALQ